MAKISYRRETKQKVREILFMTNEAAAMDMLKLIPDKQLVGHLFSHFYHKDELIKFRSVTAMGALGARVGKRNMEQARIILRRILWNLNDESGGIGWGSPEAMGEILCQSPKLAEEFKSILFSYLETGGNFIEHEMLQRGVLWGVGTYLGSNSEDMNPDTQEILSQHLLSRDVVKRVYALRALFNAKYFDNHLIPENIMADNQEVNVFINWHFITTSASAMAQAL